MSRFPTFIYAASASLALLSFTGSAFAADAAQNAKYLESALAAVGSSTSATQMGAAAQSAAQTFIGKLTSDAVSAAKAANPNISAADLAKVANDAANSEFAIAGLSAIATTATTSVLAASGQSGDASAATAVAQNISGAVNAGSSASAASAATAAGADAASVSAPQVTVTVAVKGGEVTVSTLATGGAVSATSTQTITNGVVGALKTFTSNGGSGAPEAPIVPPVDPSAHIVSPVR